jgi:hypothetical protein
MRLFSAIASGRTRLPLLLALLVIAGLAALLSPALTAAGLLAGLLLLLWDRAERERDMRRMAAALADDDIEAKLEVAEGAWGELCHAINRLLQQRRSEQQLHRLIADLPAPLAARLANLTLPPDGLACEVVVLGLGSLPGAGDPVEQLREASRAAAQQAGLHGALTIRAGNRLLLVFGGLGEARPEAALRAAQRAAFGLRDAWAARPERLRPTLSLASGSARGVALPGLGYCVIGPPIDQALALLDAGRPAALICSERAYMSLRRIGSAPPLSAAPRLTPAAGPPAYAVPLGAITPPSPPA